MDIPPPTMIRDLRSDLGQTLDQPFHGPLEFFAHKLELPEHVQEIVGQDPHEQPSLIGGKWMAPGPSPDATQGSNWASLLLEPP
jgi:hypothetical protein